jgi:large subunit ribosomal protein L29
MADKSPKAGELRQMSEEQLGLTLKDVQKQLFQLRCRAAAERLDAPSVVGKLKREIARIKTIQRERQLTAAKK